MADFRSDVRVPAFSVRPGDVNSVGLSNIRVQMPATPANSVTSGVNAGGLEIPSDQIIESEQPCNITNPGAFGEGGK